MSNKGHVCSIRLGTEEYGWLVRYCEKNETTISAVARKAIKMYRAALIQNQQKKAAAVEKE